VSKKMLLVATAVAVVLSAAATALAASQSGNDSAKGNPGNKGSSGHNTRILPVCHTVIVDGHHDDHS
jgi:hypothetical protein